MKNSVADNWWGFENGQKKMHWKPWEWMTAPKSLGGMGFRDFVIFNQAMLGRQCWRLLTEPDSLCARVLKGRYFPDSDFWSAPRPLSASYTWRSILFGRELLVKGVRWSIGDGKKVRIMEDNWIPGFSAGMYRPVDPLPANAKVECLLDHDNQCWDVNKVQGCFGSRVAEAILQIPISQMGREDFASWPHTKFGIYSVKSAYNLAMFIGMNCFSILRVSYREINSNS
jgi:hypothetical protein